jgi:hypothetical protein
MVVFFTAMFFSCDSDDQAIVVDLDINLAIEDSGGNDLLNAETDNFIQPGAIHIFYEINEKEKPINRLTSVPR